MKSVRHVLPLILLILIRIDGSLPSSPVGNLAFELEFLDPFVYEGGKKCSASDGCLRFLKKDGFSSIDNLGLYLENIYTYSTSRETVVVFSSRTYETHDNLVIFKQRFPVGLVGADSDVSQGMDGVSTGWPVFRIPNATEAPGLRFVTPGGYHTGFTLYAQGGVEDLNRLRFGESGGIVVLAQPQEVLTDSVIMTALKESMAVSVHLDVDTYQLSWGVQGRASVIPPGYEIEIIVRTDHYSINTNVKAWGAAMQLYHSSTKIKDLTVDYLGYWTDNGAAHYYNPLPYNNFEDLLLDIYNYSKENDIPLRYVQLDSWWYYKGEGRGVKDWEAQPFIFPNGIESLYEKTEWPILAHNRYFSRDNVYAIQNAGDFPFYIDQEYTKALPLDRSFWDELFDGALQWGLYTYEQDWLDRSYEEILALHTNITLGSYWLDSMGLSALERNIPIQYCMAFPRHFLHSVTLPSVTQIRVSDDYLWIPDQWKIGVTSMFADALGLKPYKDNHWTSRVNEDVVYVDCQLSTSSLPIPLLPDIDIKYGGRINHTKSGKDCLYWTDFGYDVRYPHDALRLNLCRNPEGRESAYCFTKASFDIPESQWESEECDVPTCVFECHVFNGRGIFYLGNESATASGAECAEWNMDEIGYYGSSCRNPDGKEATWCYTNEEHTEWEYCDTKCPELIEHNPSLQSAISTLSTGPVGVGDKAENLDRDLIMKTCRSDGLILKPSRPLTAIDLQLLSPEAYEIWTSSSVVSDMSFGIIFLAEIVNAPTLTAYQLNLEDALSRDAIVYQNYPNRLASVSLYPLDIPVELPTLGCNDIMEFCLYYTAPVYDIGSGRLAILGEVDKWTPISSLRVKSIDPSSLTATLIGLGGERVSIAYWSSKEGVFEVTCEFTTNGEMALDPEAKTCVKVFNEPADSEDSAPIPHAYNFLLLLLTLALLTL